MKRKKRVNIRKEGENDCRAAKYKEKVVLGMTFDISSLTKDIRKEIYKEMLPK
jgi:hypothetical protein